MSSVGISSSWRLGAYASGNFGKNILWGTGEITLLYMLTDLIGLDPALAGGVLLTSLVFDALLAPVVGHVADRFPARIGKYGGLIVVGAPLASLAFVALYSLPLISDPELWLVLLLIVCFRVGYSLIDAPHNALIGQVRRDGPGRARLAGYRFFFSSLAGLVIALAIAPIMASGETAGASPDHLFRFAAVVACLSCVIMIVSWGAVRHADPVDILPTHAENFAVGTTLRLISASPLTVLTLFAGTAAASGLPLFNKAVLYLSKSVLNAPELASPVLVSLVAGQFIGLPFWIWLSSTRGKIPALGLAHGVVAAGSLMCLFLGIATPAWLLSGAVLFGVGAGGVYTVIWGLLADAVDEIFARTGARPEARIFAMAIFLQKVAIGVGAGLFGLALGYAEYDPARASAPANFVILAFGLGLPLAAALICCATLAMNKPEPALIPQ